MDKQGEGGVTPQPEQQARETIDRLLTNAGWHVCDAGLCSGGRDRHRPRLEAAEVILSMSRSVTPVTKASDHFVIADASRQFDFNAYGLKYGL